LWNPSYRWHSTGGSGRELRPTRDSGRRAGSYRKRGQRPGLVTGIIFLLIAPYNQNKLIRFHAFQSIFLHVAFIILWILLGMLGILTHGLGFFLYPLLGLLAIIVWLYMMFTAYNGKKVKLPVIGDLAEKQA
jgi:uncharacterized membrane protein